MYTHNYICSYVKMYVMHNNKYDKQYGNTILYRVQYSCSMVWYGVWKCAIVCNFRWIFHLVIVFRVIKLLLYSVPEHRKKVKKNLQYIAFRPYRGHSGKLCSSRMLRIHEPYLGKVDLSLQMHILSAWAYLRKGSGLLK